MLLPVIFQHCAIGQVHSIQYCCPFTSWTSAIGAGVSQIQIVLCCSVVEPLVLLNKMNSYISVYDRSIFKMDRSYTEIYEFSTRFCLFASTCKHLNRLYLAWSADLTCLGCLTRLSLYAVLFCAPIRLLPRLSPFATYTICCWCVHVGLIRC